MILRSILGFGALATVAALSGAAQAQGFPPPYPPYGAQSYPPPYRPVPALPIPDDDDDDDIPPHQRAAPGYYPPPPGNYRGPFAREPQYQPPAPVYGDRGPQPYYGPRRNAAPGGGSGQPESYGAAPGYPNQARPQFRAYPQPYPQAYPQQAYPGQQPVESVSAGSRPDAARPRTWSAPRA